VCFLKIVDHAGRRGDMAQVLDQWRHLVALSEAPDVLHRVMRPALYHGTRMAIQIASDSPVNFVFFNFFVCIKPLS